MTQDKREKTSEESTSQSTKQEVEIDIKNLPREVLEEALMYARHDSTIKALIEVVQMTMFKFAEEARPDSVFDPLSAALVMFSAGSECLSFVGVQGMDDEEVHAIILAMGRIMAIERMEEYRRGRRESEVEAN